MQAEQILKQLEEAIFAIPKPPEMSELSNEQIIDTKEWVAAVLLIVRLDAKTRVWSNFLTNLLETANRIDQVKKDQFIHEFGDRPIKED